MREGLGYEVYTNKDVYFGYFSRNQRHGKGKLIKHATNETYTGQFYQGMRHGYGAWRKEGSEFHYSGMWSNNKPWGYGILRSHIGDVFEGNFHNGYKHGTGMETYKDGGTYVGNFKDGQPEGFGRLTSLDGSVFEGLFIKGQKDGRGKWTIPIVIERRIKGRMIKLDSGGNLAEWEGTVVNNRVEGHGNEHWSSGVEYRGEFLDNKRHGYGRMIQRDNTVYEG